MNGTWYKDAIIYAIDVARFADGDGDGIGDFKGLTERIPYLADLGVTCLWILPCYPSSHRDNGYDVDDHYRIAPRLGSFDDFLRFLHRAGEHGMRVILDLILDHTSVGHPWFQAARQDNHSRFRDYYVWSPSPPPVSPEDRTIFPGQETTVWTYDDVARAFYHHRFYHFEPSLNLANPELRDEILRIMDYWMSFGIAGFRLDAASHAVASKPVESASIDQPHQLLRDFYQHARARRDDALLLAEIDEDPEALKTFFGNGDQLSLIFNFYVNNFIFLALARGEAEPIHQAMRAVPQPPDPCQWANFLRNLDELDLERLSEEERQEVNRAFAPEEHMRLFGRGIRRRLAPLLGGDLRRLKQAFSLLFALPGAPMFVYGDEIGMGEDLSQKGRDAVRPPMQWSSAPNGGFAPASAKRLTQPAIADGPFSYRKVNVEAQRGDPGSLWAFVRKLCYLRRQHTEIGRHNCQLLDAGDKRVFGQAYPTETGLLLILHNLADAKAKAEVALGGRHSGTLEDLTGHPAVEMAEGRLALEIEPYGYRWFHFAA